MRRGFTLIELLVVVTIGGVLVSLVAPHWARYQDRLAVHQAAAEVASFYSAARYAAIVRSQRVRLEFAADVLRAVYEGVVDSTFLTRPGPSRRGVTLEASRLVIRISPNGLGYGAANAKFLLRRGPAVDSLTTSRLGRLRRW
jgi:prepilin-type N-terminal cleavage/methylation domain-containing protein